MDMFEGVGRRSDQRTGSFLDLGQHGLNGWERKILFRNNGDGTFTDVAYVNGADPTADGRGLSRLDVDGDGREDLLLRNYRQPAILLHHYPSGGHWIALRLVGVRSNRDAVGARIRVRTGDHWQTRAVNAGSGYLSGQSLTQHFGLGAATEADVVEITWPSGEATKLGPLAADRRYIAVEGEPTVVDPGPRAPTRAR